MTNRPFSGMPSFSLSNILEIQEARARVERVRRLAFPPQVGRDKDGEPFGYYMIFAGSQSLQLLSTDFVYRCGAPSCLQPGQEHAVVLVDGCRATDYARQLRLLGLGWRWRVLWGGFECNGARWRR